MSVIIAPMAIYELSGGSEVYKWDQDWFLCFMNESDFNESQYGQVKPTYSEARVAVGLPKCTMFYISSMFDSGLVHVDRAVDMTWAIGKTIRAYVKPKSDNRYIEVTFNELTSTASQRVVRMEYTYYYNGNSYLSDYNTISLDRQGDNSITGTYYSLPFVSSVYDAYVSGSAVEYWDYNTETRGYACYGYWNYNSNIKYWAAGWDPTIPDEDNPYYDGGTSGIGGGGGNFSDNSDTVDEDQLPSKDAVGTGFATLFTPSKAQLKSLADVMWNSNIFTALQNLVENITNMFTSLAIVPFEVTPGSTVEVTWLGLPITELYLTLAAQQYYEFNMGSINMANDSRIYTSGSALDYSPFSKLGIFLPFIGFQELDIDECRDATIGLKYRIDILSGTCVALISVNGNTIYQFSGNCLSQIPITNENMQSLVSDAVNVGIAATNAHAASGAASAEMSAAGNTEIKSLSDLDKANKASAHAQSHLGMARGHLASATANAAMGLKPTFGKAGSISASASLLAVKQPYIFLTTPNQCIPDHYQKYCGFPSNISGKLNTFSGYTVVESIRLNGLVATSLEVGEIYELLKNGVII